MDDDKDRYFEKLQKGVAKLGKSTIRYGGGLEEASEVLGIDNRDLVSRKPHTKLGTGSSGTDHQGADGKAAIRAKKIVVDRIEENTGVRMEPREFLKSRKKERATQEVRLEKESKVARKRVAIDQQNQADQFTWMVSLVPLAFRQKQALSGNDLPTISIKKKEKERLARLAEENGWETEWDDSFAQWIWSHQ